MKGAGKLLNVILYLPILKFLPRMLRDKGACLDDASSVLNSTSMHFPELYEKIQEFYPPEWCEKEDVKVQ